MSSIFNSYNTDNKKWRDALINKIVSIAHFDSVFQNIEHASLIEDVEVLIKEASVLEKMVYKDAYGTTIDMTVEALRIKYKPINLTFSDDYKTYKIVYSQESVESIFQVYDFKVLYSSKEDFELMINKLSILNHQLFLALDHYNQNVRTLIY